MSAETTGPSQRNRKRDIIASRQIEVKRSPRKEKKLSPKRPYLRRTTYVKISTPGVATPLRGDLKAQS